MVVQGPEVAASRPSSQPRRRTVSPSTQVRRRCTFSSLALGIGPGDEVIVPPPPSPPPRTRFVGRRTASLRRHQPDTCCLDPKRRRALIGPRTAAIMPVHLYGWRSRNHRDELRSRPSTDWPSWRTPPRRMARSSGKPL